MNISIFSKLLSAIQPKKLGRTFVAIFGLFWLFIEPAGIFWPQWLNWGLSGYIGLVVFSLLCTILLNLPRISVSRSLSGPDSTIEIKIGDLFDEPGHLVIGTNDVFDTELGEVINPSSVQGQFLTQVYQGDQRRLDADINTALENIRDTGKKDANKKKGKSWRYPIGTTLVLASPDKRYFLTAYGYMRNDLRVKSTADDIWHSLSRLWKEVRLKGHGSEIAIPIIGSGLARTNLPRMTLTKLIIISFIAASKEEFVSKKLTIVLHPNDLDSVDFYALEEILNLTCF